MRLRRLKLRRYGCFEEVDLDLATEPGRITIIVAPNGAGKSVLRHAFHDLLFDIPMQSPMKFRHGYTGMALHAEVIAGDGTEFGFGWVRGGKPPRVTTDPERFAALQRGVTPQQLERLFALDTAGLRRGGTDLKGGATLAGALLAGTGELAPAKSVRAIIDSRRQANWGQGKSKPPLNAAASKLDFARKNSRAAVRRPEKREREERDAEDQQMQYDAAKRQRDESLAETRRLNRVALTRPHLDALREAEDWLVGHPDSPALPAGLDQQLAEARASVATAQATHEGARQELALAIEAADSIKIDPEANRCADRLDRLAGMLGEAQNKAEDILKRRAEHATKLDDVHSALRDIGASVPAGQAGEVIPTLGLMAEARTAITQHAGLRKAFDLACERLDEATTARNAAEAQPVAVAALPDGLVALLAEMRADRNPVQHAAAAAEQARKAAAEVTRTLALVPGWTGTAAALRALTPASEATFERLDEAHQSAAANARRARDDLADLAARDAEKRMALSILREQPLPDAVAIAAARNKRDTGMRLVLRRAFAAPPTAAEDNAYAGSEPVALVYERQVRSADDLADRRTAELGRVQEADRLTRLIRENAGPLQNAWAAEAEAAGCLREAELAWASIMAPLGLDRAATMAELRKLLAARLQLVERMKDAEVAAGARAQLTELHHEWTRRLASSLAVPAESLAELLTRADDRVVKFQSAERTGAAHQAALQAAERTLRDAANARAKSEGALAQWREIWSTLLVRLHRPETETPEAISAVLNGIAKLDQDHRAAVSLERRIDDMRQDLDRFAAVVTALAEALEEDETGAPAEVARALLARAAAAAAAESARRQAERSVDQARTAADKSAGDLADAAKKLAAVIAACGAANAEDAESRIAASRAHAHYAVGRDKARAALMEHGDGMTIPALQAEADSVAAEDIADRRQLAEEAGLAAAANVETAAVMLNQLKTALEAEAAATVAVDARADYEAAAAEFSRRLEEQIVLNLATAMLDTAMLSVEEDMGGSSLARVSATFAAVTGGAYGLETQDGALGDELHAIERAYPEERKSLDDLSEGTRDQLYLALRIAALREHCASATALPFIADDILQTFDDERATATLRVLVELSNELQVIVLTHHTHLGHIAAALNEGQVHLLNLYEDSPLLGRSITRE